MTEEPLAWLGSSLEDVRTFPADAKLIFNSLKSEVLCSQALTAVDLV